MRRYQDILLVTINPGLAIVGVLPGASPDVFYTATLRGYGGIDPYDWAIVGGALPTGYLTSIDSNGDLVISGTTSEIGEFLFTVLLRDSSGKSVTKPFRLRVIALPLILDGNAPDGTIGVPYSFTYTVEGGRTPYTFTVDTGFLPDGLTLNAATGEISGTPTTGQTRSFAILVTDSDSPAATSLVEDGITIAYDTLAVAGAWSSVYVGQPLGGSPRAITGGLAPYSVTLLSGTRPAGVTIAVSGSNLTATGNTTTNAAYAWTDRVSSTDGQFVDLPASVSITYPTLVVTGAFTDTDLGDPLNGSPLAITGGDGSYSLSGAPYSGTRPAGVTISVVGSNLVASGNTTTAASYAWTERVLSGDGQHFDIVNSVDITSSDPFFANVVALLHFDGTNGGTSFPDETGRTWTPNTGVTTSTVQQKFGTASALFNGSTGYLDAASSLDFAFGTGDFTIEFFMYGGTGFNAYVIDIGSNGIVLQITSGPKILAYTSGTGIGGALYAGAFYPSTGWSHIALVRNGSSLSLYVNGVLGATQTTSQNFNTAVAPHIGRYGGGGATRYTGYIDELRITKGVARYTAAFTPPTAPFPNS